MNKNKKILGLFTVSLIVSISLLIYAVYQFVNNVSHNNAYIWLGLGNLLANLIFILVSVLLFLKEEIFLGHLVLLFKMIFIPTFTSAKSLLQGNPTFDLFFIILFLISTVCMFFGLKMKPVVVRHIRWLSYSGILLAFVYESIVYNVPQGLYTNIPNFVLISTHRRESKILFTSVFIRYPFILVDALVNNPNQPVFFYLATIIGILFFIYTLINLFLKPSRFSKS